MAKTPSPCIGVCKFRRPGPAGLHCLGCSMTKAQKRLSKRARKPEAMDGFVALVVAQQERLGRFGHWRAAYLKRCLKKGVQPPRAARKPS